MPFVTGKIVFGSDFKPFFGATVYVRLEEVSRIDHVAELVAIAVMREVHAGGPPDEINFTLEAPHLESRARYVVRIHVDVDDDGQAGIGDYVSTASHLVMAEADSTVLLIPVKRIS